MRRRDFITLLGGAVAWPHAARAQQGGRVRRIGVLMPLDENEPLSKSNVTAFTQALADLGWADGRNVRMDLRWGGGDINRMRAIAQELVGLQPDIMLAGSFTSTAALQRETGVVGDRAMATIDRDIIGNARVPMVRTDFRKRPA
jgi:putative ABC transport system substrate-binding protein